jgi:hypothetical protein
MDSLIFIPCSDLTGQAELCPIRASNFLALTKPNFVAAAKKSQEIIKSSYADVVLKYDHIKTSNTQL